MSVYESIVFSLHAIFSLNTRILSIQVQNLLGGDDTAYQSPSTVFLIFVTGTISPTLKLFKKYISNIDGRPANRDIKIIPNISPRSNKKMPGDRRAAAQRASASAQHATRRPHVRNIS